MKKLFLILAVVPAYMVARAQFVTDYLKAADNYYKKGDYYSAAQYYEKYLTTNSSKKSKENYSPYAVKTATGAGNAATTNTQQVVYNLADSYRRLNYPAKAVAYYEKALSYDNAQNPLAGYYYAVTLRELGKDEEAEKAFQLFLDKYKQDDVYSQSARVEVLNLHFIREQLKRPDLHLYTLEKQNQEINPTGANYSPVWLNSGALLFTSTRPMAANENEKEKPFVNRVYQATFSGSDFSNVKKVNLPQPANTHQGVVSLTADGNTLFLTRWLIAASGKKTSAIYTSKKLTDTSWAEPVLADSVINAKGFNAQQPFVMPGGKYLLFSSDKAGGFGGFDLYAAPLDEAGKPGAAVNLGAVINTAGDEQAPYYHEPSATLVFSCNGRTGMGGFDFFYSNGTIGNFTAPTNFGYPVNSVKDDLYFASRATANNILADVLISSDRSAACCLELFSLKKRKPLKQISGTVVYCKDQSLLQGVSINIVDTINNKTVYTATTGADGSYAFTIDEYQPLKAVATLSGYNDGALQFNTPGDAAKDSLINPAICLGKDVPSVEEVVVIDNVYYDFDQFSLRSDSYEALDKIVSMLNKYPTMVIEIRAHTDSKGTEDYNIKLSESRAKSVVAYLVSKGIDKTRLQSKGFGASSPVASNANEDGTDNPEGRQANRRTEFKVLKK